MAKDWEKEGGGPLGERLSNNKDRTTCKKVIVIGVPGWLS